MKLKDILKNKVLYVENLGDSYYWDFRLIVKINKNKIVLLEYQDSCSGYDPFFVESVNKEFVDGFFTSFNFQKLRNEKKKIKLEFESTLELEKQIDFSQNPEFLEQEIVVLDLKDIQEYIEKE